MTTKVLCGPLLRYTHIDHVTSMWHGSVLIVSEGAQKPTIEFPQSALSQPTNSSLLFSGRNRSFWRFDLSIPLNTEASQIWYCIKSSSILAERRSSFWLPGKDESMRAIFHSCNKLSTMMKPGRFADGPALWRDVLSKHVNYPIHLRIGGGDQVYSDGVMSLDALREWSQLDLARRLKARASNELLSAMDDWYFANYCKMYGTGPFKDVAAQIPAIQMFDDHDILDGFGSYKKTTMASPMFHAIGKAAWKYYMLFQHHTPPDGEISEEKTWVLGKELGPYMKERSRSISTTFGRRIAFFGLDCRTERNLNRICHESTYDAMFDRLENQVVKGQTAHLILMVPGPVIFPRLPRLEALLTRVGDIVHQWSSTPAWLQKLFKLNNYDGNPAILDDILDHWCSTPHLAERNKLIERLIEFANRKDVRVTILSGDVHLACVGLFRSRVAEGIQPRHDRRHILNVVSSPIANRPMPSLAKSFLVLLNRLKTHHTNNDTTEGLVRVERSAAASKLARSWTMLSARNYCIISEVGGTDNNDAECLMTSESSVQIKSSQDLRSLNISICAEIDAKDPQGRTIEYRLNIPSLTPLRNRSTHPQ